MAKISEKEIRTAMQDACVAPGEYMLAIANCYVNIFNEMLADEESEATISTLESLAQRGGDLPDAMVSGLARLGQYQRQNPKMCAAVSKKLEPKLTQLTKELGAKKASLSEIILRVEQAYNNDMFPDGAEVRALIAQTKAVLKL